MPLPDNLSANEALRLAYEANAEMVNCAMAAAKEIEEGDYATAENHLELVLESAKWMKKSPKPAV